MHLSDIAHLRLFNQHLSQRIFGKPEQVVSWLGAVQSQDYAGAKWAVGQRIQGCKDADVEQAFMDGKILRTHVLRPTWHFVAPPDIRWMLALTAPRVHAANAHMYRRLELDAAVFRRSNPALVKALQGGKHLTRDELRVVFHKAGIAADNLLRTTYLVMRAELDGIICSGPRRGKQFTYALLEERVPPVKTLTREEALAELTHRFFMSRGPATVQDFAKWSGLTVADGRSGLETVKDKLQREASGDQTYWFAASTPPTTAKAPTAYMLSIYDEYISGYKDRSALGEAEVGVKLFAMGNILQFILVMDGQIAGTWKRTLKKNEVLIDLQTFKPLTKAEERAVTMAAEEYGDFLGLSVVLQKQTAQ